MDKDKQPGIIFDGIILSKEEFMRKPSMPDDYDVNIDFKANIFSDEKNDSAVEMETNLTLVSKGYEDSEEAHVRLRTNFIGFFSVISEDENMNIQEFLHNHAPALMLPYIREHISSITQKSGIKPIYIPPLNIVAMLNNKEATIQKDRNKLENTSDIQD